MRACHGAHSKNFAIIFLMARSWQPRIDVPQLLRVFQGVAQRPDGSPLFSWRERTPFQIRSGNQARILQES
jgi:hypothetical protein